MTTKNNVTKRTYSSPQIERITLDNEISLTLDSTTPDTEPGHAQAPEYFNNDPFKSNMA